MQMSLKATILLSIAYFGSVINAAEIDLSQVNVDEIQKRLPPEFANANVSLESVKTLVRDKCIQVAGKEKGEEAFGEIEGAVVTLSDCATGLLNFTALQDEIDEASPKGDLDVVFNKYCKKQPQALACVEAFNSKLSTCLDKEEKEHRDVFMRIIRSLLSFICHKGGDQIALFIAEKGPECLDSKKNDIQDCANKTFYHYLPKDGFQTLKTLPKFIMGPKQCEDMAELETCVVQKLEKCSEITPANIIESMFRFIKNETVCHNTPRLGKQAPMTSGVSAVLVIQELKSVVGLLCISLFYQLRRVEV